MLSLLQPTYTQHFLHYDRLIRVQLRSSYLIINDNISTHRIHLSFTSNFSTQQDSHGNLTSLSIYSDRVVHLAHNNPTVLQQWAQLLHKHIHKVGFYKDYSILQPIGEGGSSKVFLAKAYKDGSKAVAKAFSKKKIQKKDLLAIQNEIKILYFLDSHYFPQLLKTYETQNSYYLIMEYAPGITLKQLVDKSSIDFQQKKRILIQVAFAIQCLHKVGIIHRDIKPQNILYNLKTGEIKIIDFGFSVFSHQKHSVYTNCGTPGYAAPESLNKNCQPSASNDVFALGVLAHFLFTSKIPYRSEGRSILLQTRDLNFSFSSKLNKYPLLLQILKKMVCQQSQRTGLTEFINTLHRIDRFESPNNPQSKLHRKIQNLNTLNTRAESYTRERGLSMKSKNNMKSNYGVLPYHKNIRLITDRF